MAEIISQTKIFADFGATTGGSGGGAIWLQHATKLQCTDERSAEGVKAIGVSGFAGIRRKQGGGKIMLTENRVDDPQVAWRALLKDRKYFMIMVQDENGGVREKYLHCTVSKVDRSSDDEGQHTDEIEIIYSSQV